MYRILLLQQACATQSKRGTYDLLGGSLSKQSSCFLMDLLDVMVSHKASPYSGIIGHKWPLKPGSKLGTFCSMP